MARISEAEAVRLGLIEPGTVGRKSGKKKPSTKGMGRGGAKTRCTTCHAEFTGDTAEERHMTEHKHYRFELVLEEA